MAPSVTQSRLPDAQNSTAESVTCRRCKLGLEVSEASELTALLFGATSGGPLTPAQIRTLCSRDITPEDYDMLLRLDEDIVVPASGVLSAAACERLEAPQANANWQGETCAVCLGDLLAGEDVRELPCCSHVYHKECIVQWLTCSKATCPLDSLSVHMGTSLQEDR